MEAFLPSTIQIEDMQNIYKSGYWRESGSYLMSQIANNYHNQEIKVTAPYHIINTNLQTGDSDNPKLRNRMGENFIISPLYIGSEHTAYIKTEEFEKRGEKIDLATALAISGAAVDANTYFTGSKPLTFLMTVLNLRLGYWLSNPANNTGKRVSPFRWYRYLFSELFGKMRETSKKIRISDGGHFENLGVYELIRRECDIVICSDVGADPEMSFKDLARLIELVRIDFGTKIEIVLDGLMPDNHRISTHSYTIGEIKYKRPNGTTKTGILYYIKPNLLKGMSQDIFGYAFQNHDFPHQSTADQYFDETQFEAYREMGFFIGENFVNKSDVLENIFKKELKNANL
jgi:hypothetical protein